jgi:Trypsin
MHRQDPPTVYRVTHWRGRHSLRHLIVRANRSSARARASIVGGGQIPIGQAPWQVFVVGVIPLGPEEALLLLCGGSIVDETHVVTAGHCQFDPETGSRIPAEHVFVVAGTSNFRKIEASEQETEAANIRIHPDYEYALGAGAPDDVAVIELAHPLTFNPSVQPIGLVAAGETPAEGAQVNLTGFGREAPSGELEGPLHSIGMTVGFSRPCGGSADAVFLCASAAGGSGCEGDSGSALTGGVTPALVGVMDTVEVISGEACLASTANGFVNVAAPEIRDFIEGDEDPPVAPRGGGISIRAITRVGETATCEPGSWSGSPTFEYRFLNSAGNQVLQVGSSSTYPLTEADLGVSISCEVLAGNAGGIGVARTNALPSIASELPPAESGPLPPDEPGPVPPYESKISPGAAQSGSEASQRVVEEFQAQQRKKQEELEAIERVQQDFEAGIGKAKAATEHCVVPSLRGDSLGKAGRALDKAHCRLGKVTSPRGRSTGKLVVIGQRFSPGRKLPVNARVGVNMGPPPRHRK